jgi:thiamine-phosphate pyrophosphorylase
MVGKSTHSVDQAIRAFFGAVILVSAPFATPTKPDYPPIGLGEIRKVHDAVRIDLLHRQDWLENLPETPLRRPPSRDRLGLLLANNIASYARLRKSC